MPQPFLNGLLVNCIEQPKGKYRKVEDLFQNNELRPELAKRPVNFKVGLEFYTLKVGLIGLQLLQWVVIWLVGFFNFQVRGHHEMQCFVANNDPVHVWLSGP